MEFGSHLLPRRSGPKKIWLKWQNAVSRRHIPIEVRQPAGERDASIDVNWDAVDWNDLIPRLLLVASVLIRRRTWRGQVKGPVLGGREAEDFVFDAIYKTIDGLRRWDANRISLFVHLCGVIRSDVNHWAMRVENRVTILENENEKLVRADVALNPEQQAIVRSENEALLSFLRNEDPVLGYMAKVILEEDLIGSQELSARLGVSVAKINNQKKRLKRRISAFKKREESKEGALGR